MRYLLTFLYLITLPALAQQPASSWVNRLKTAPDNDKVGLYIQISQEYAAGQPDSAVIYCNRAMQLAEKLNDQEGLARVLLQLGRINRLHHHTELARRFENEALFVFRHLHDTTGMAKAYNELGLLDARQKNISSASHDFRQAMNYYRDIHDSAGMLNIYHSMGTAYEERGDVEKALGYYLRTLGEYEHRKQKPEAYFILLRHISDLYLKKGDRSSALHYINRGISSSEHDFQDKQIRLLDAAGNVYEQEGNNKSALRYYKLALENAKKYNQPEEQAAVLIDIASVLKKENTNESLKDLKRALAIADSLHHPQLEASIYAAMAEVYRQERNYKEAMLAMEEQHELLDSLLKADTIQEIAALDSSYQLKASLEQIHELQLNNKLEKKELNVSLVLLGIILMILLLLTYYLIKVRRLNEQLRASNHIKDTLFSVIGHDLKGPAGSAAQLLELMETESFDEQELRSMISELRKQTEASFTLLNNLFEWGKAQMRGVRLQPEDFNPKDVITRSISLLTSQAAEKNILISDDTPAGYMVHADVNQFDFIIRNLLSNAIKFTSDKGGILIRSQLSEDGSEVVFSIKDNGVGISTARQQEFLKGKLQVTFGTQGEKGSGLGLLLTQEFINANKGRIWLESREGQGSTFYFTLPLSHSLH